MDAVRITRSDDGTILSVIAEGPYTLAEVKAVLCAATSDSPSGRDCCLLMDIRRSEAVPSTDELREFAVFLGDLPANLAARSAWLVSADLRFGLARVLSAHAELKGITLKVFRESAAALQWLHEGHRAGHVGDRPDSE